jgi:hypothetical protein
VRPAGRTAKNAMAFTAMAFFRYFRVDFSSRHVANSIAIQYEKSRPIKK